MLSRFYRIPERDGQTNRRTELLYQYRASACSRAIKIVRLAVRTVCQYHSLLNYAVVQLRRKRTILHWSNIADLHTGTTNEQFFVFSPLFSFDFDLRLIVVIVMSFCVSMPHSTNIGPFAAFTSCRFSRWRPYGTPFYYLILNSRYV